jgi:hypothetical protein
MRSGEPKNGALRVLASIGIGLFLLGGCASSAVKSGTATDSAASGGGGSLKEQEARDTAIDAYVYGYPLVTMEMTRRVMTNVAVPEGSRAPMGQLVRMKKYPTAAFRDVTAPNADTLYTTAWLDVSKEPWILSLPNMRDRYFLFPMLDGWTNVFRVPGKRTMGGGPHKYAITGPGWNGKLPSDVTEYKSPTALVWILGRIYCDGTPGDYDTVHAAQSQISLVPLSSYGKSYKAPRGQVDSTIDMKTAVRDQVDALDGTAYFTLLAELLKTNPPAVDDASMIGKLATVGVVLGRSFDPAKLDPAVLRGIQASPKPAQAKIMSWLQEGVAAGDDKLENGWFFTTKTGLYETNYRQRALITAIGLGANRPQDAIYPTSEGPDASTKYDGTKRYVMHFEKGAMPPVGGFWSLTMYDDKFFFVENRLNRYTLSQRDKLKANRDGSIDLYIQHDSPGKDKESNWLPAPSGAFVLMMRLYWPNEKSPTILDGSWKVPPVREAS